MDAKDKGIAALNHDRQVSSSVYGEELAGEAVSDKELASSREPNSNADSNATAGARGGA